MPYLHVVNYKINLKGDRAVGIDQLGGASLWHVQRLENKHFGAGNHVVLMLEAVGSPVAKDGAYRFLEGQDVEVYT